MNMLSNPVEETSSMLTPDVHMNYAAPKKDVCLSKELVNERHPTNNSTRPTYNHVTPTQLLKKMLGTKKNPGYLKDSGMDPPPTGQMKPKYNGTQKILKNGKSATSN